MYGERESRGLRKRQSRPKKAVKKAGKEQIFDRPLSMHTNASYLVKAHSLDYIVYMHMTMTVTQCMESERAGVLEKGSQGQKRQSKRQAKVCRNYHIIEHSL
jgi:hypothetical protein